MAHTHTLLWSSFKCAARAGTSASSSFFFFLLEKVVVLQDGLLLLSLFTYLLVGADLVESGPDLGDEPQISTAFFHDFLRG